MTPPATDVAARLDEAANSFDLAMALESDGLFEDAGEGVSQSRRALQMPGGCFNSPARCP